MEILQRWKASRGRLTSQTQQLPTRTTVAVDVRYNEDVLLDQYLICSWGNGPVSSLSDHLRLDPVCVLLSDHLKKERPLLV